MKCGSDTAKVVRPAVTETHPRRRYIRALGGVVDADMRVLTAKAHAVRLLFHRCWHFLILIVAEVIGAAVSD